MKVKTLEKIASRNFMPKVDTNNSNKICKNILYQNRPIGQNLSLKNVFIGLHFNFWRKLKILRKLKFGQN